MGVGLQSAETCPGSATEDGRPEDHVDTHRRCVARKILTDGFFYSRFSRNTGMGSTRSAGYYGIIFPCHECGYEDRTIAFRFRLYHLKSGIYLKNPPDFISSSLDFDLNFACFYSSIEKRDTFCLIAKKGFPITNPTFYLQKVN